MAEVLRLPLCVDVGGRDAEALWRGVGVEPPPSRSAQGSLLRVVRMGSASTPKPVALTPRSAEALLSEGVEPGDLWPRPREAFTTEGATDAVVEMVRREGRTRPCVPLISWVSIRTAPRGLACSRRCLAGPAALRGLRAGAQCQDGRGATREDGGAGRRLAGRRCGWGTPRLEQHLPPQGLRRLPASDQPRGDVSLRHGGGAMRR
jgi:hypothetical protein